MAISDKLPFVIVFNGYAATRQQRYSDEIKQAFRVMKRGNIFLSSASDSVVFRHQPQISGGKE
jgi:hypothetical protein